MTSYLNASTADRLRAAATTLRECAQAATPPADPYPGGWSGFGIGNNAGPMFGGELWRSALYGGPAEDGYRTGTVVEVKEDCDRNNCGCAPMSQADTDYIATMHPGVGLALAAWLERQAYGAATRGDDTADPYAVDVADEILGVPADRALAMQAAVDEVLS